MVRSVGFAALELLRRGFGKLGWTVKFFDHLFKDGGGSSRTGRGSKSMFSSPSLLFCMGFRRAAFNPFALRRVGRCPLLRSALVAAGALSKR